MKTTLAMLILSFLWIAEAFGDRPRVWMRLSQNGIFVNALIVCVDADYFEVEEEGHFIRVPIDAVEEIVPVKQSSILDGAAIGAGAGLLAGVALAEFVFKDSEPQRVKPEATTIFLAVIGGIIGSVSGSASQPSEKIYVITYTREQKREILVRFSTNRVRDRAKQIEEEF